MENSDSETSIVDNETLSLLPEKSRSKYINSYIRFKKWCETNNAPDIVQDIVLKYFQQRSKEVAPTSLWSEYSMIKSLILIERGVDIGIFTKLIYFLKRNCVNYRPKKSNVLTQEDMFKFVSTADDKKYLMKKVALLMGITGAMRMDELCMMTTNDIREENGILNVIIPKSKTYTSRQFVLKGVYKDINFVDVVKKYLDCRPANGSNRLFLRYVNGSCSNQPLGINTLSKIPLEVATYLELPDAHLYTGHCFRRSAVTIEESREIIKKMAQKSFQLTSLSGDDVTQPEIEYHIPPNTIYKDSITILNNAIKTESINGEFIKEELPESSNSIDGVENNCFLNQVNMHMRSESKEETEFTAFINILTHKLKTVKNEHLSDLVMNILNFTHNEIKKLK